MFEKLLSKDDYIQYSLTTTSHYHALSCTQCVTHAKSYRVPRRGFQCMSHVHGHVQLTYCMIVTRVHA